MGTPVLYNGDNAYRASLIRSYGFDPSDPASAAAHAAAQNAPPGLTSPEMPGGEFSQRLDRLQQLGQAPTGAEMSLRDALARSRTKSAEDTDAEKLERQSREIINERSASNTADAQFGDQMAMRGLTRAVTQRKAMGQADLDTYWSPNAQMQRRQQMEDTLQVNAPKYDAQRRGEDVKALIAQIAAQARQSTGAGNDHARILSSLIQGLSHIEGSGFDTAGSGVNTDVDSLMKYLGSQGIGAQPGAQAQAGPQVGPGAGAQGQAGTPRPTPTGQGGIAEGATRAINGVPHVWRQGAGGVGWYPLTPGAPGGGG